MRHNSFKSTNMKFQIVTSIFFKNKSEETKINVKKLEGIHFWQFLLLSQPLTFKVFFCFN